MTAPAKTSLERARETWMKVEANLRDRRGVKWGFNDIDDDVFEELRSTQSGIIAQAIEDAERRGMERVFEMFCFNLKADLVEAMQRRYNGPRSVDMTDLVEESHDWLRSEIEKRLGEK